ncbi:MAG: type II glyceraldehyde-3-phosphate dehydrogenase [Desulfurococcaceae archaeon]
MPVKVAVNGYGTIGKRIAHALLKSPDFELVGIAKYNFDYSAVLAHRLGMKIFVPRDKLEEFRKHSVEPEGSIEDLVSEAELVYDASPAGRGARNKELYVKYKKPAIFQGGELPEVAEVSYNTLCNFEKALGKSYVRVVSCNTTGLLRVVCSLGSNAVESVFGVIVRRASDPKEDLKGPVSSLALDSAQIPSHHALDARTVVGDLAVETVAIVAPTTLMHVQVLKIRLRKPAGFEQVVESLESSGRVLLLDAAAGIDTTGKLVELARDAGRPRYDVYENVVLASSLSRSGVELTLVQAVHQEAIVIPENVDAAYAVLNLETDVHKVVEKTNKLLGVGELKYLIARGAK